MKNLKIDIGIIGGTGSELKLDNSEKLNLETPYGYPSADITIGEYHGDLKVAFLPRHGIGHSIPPHNINYRANIWALKELGIKTIISPSAVGSLKLNHERGKFILVDQYIDRTKRRIETFYERGKVCHVGQADPYCDYLNNLFYEKGKELNLNIQKGGTYVCIEGPRFSTRAESKIFRQWGGDIIGMTTYPESVLAAEKEICYCCIAMVTDLDVWAAECPKCGIVEYRERCEKCGGKLKKISVNVPDVLSTIEQNAANLKTLLEETIIKIDNNRDCRCHHTLDGAFI